MVYQWFLLKKKGVEEIVIDKKNGYLSSNDNIDYLIEKIKYLQENEIPLNELKQNCQRSIYKFDTNLITELTIQSYQSLIKWLMILIYCLILLSIIKIEI